MMPDDGRQTSAAKAAIAQAEAICRLPLRSVALDPPSAEDPVEAWCAWGNNTLPSDPGGVALQNHPLAKEGSMANPDPALGGSITGELARLF